MRERYLIKSSSLLVLSFVVYNHLFKISLRTVHLLLQLQTQNGFHCFLPTANGHHETKPEGCREHTWFTSTAGQD